jgi:hypothetical protein
VVSGHGRLLAIERSSSGSVPGTTGGEPASSCSQGRNRTQLYELAKREEISGRSKMGKSELIRALRAAR